MSWPCRVDEAYRGLDPAEGKRAQSDTRCLREEELEHLKVNFRYGADCKEREKEVAEHNASIDDLEAALGYGVADAVEEYVGIVLANSCIPTIFRFSKRPSSTRIRLS